MSKKYKILLSNVDQIRDILLANWPWEHVIIGVFVQFPHFWVCMMCSVASSHWKKELKTGCKTCLCPSFEIMQFYRYV